MSIESLFYIFIIFFLLYLIVNSDRDSSIFKIRINKESIAESSIVVLTSFINRRIGLLNHSRLGPGDGVVIKSSSSITTKNMKFPISLYFINKANIVVAVMDSVPEGKTIRIPSKYLFVLEVAVNNTFDIRLGDKVDFIKEY